jgi:hypothetical protein
MILLLVLLTGAGVAGAPAMSLVGANYEIRSGRLSADASQIVMIVQRVETLDYKVLLYNRASDELRLLPSLPANWLPDSPVFSHDGRRIALDAQCLQPCRGTDDRTRLMMLELSGGDWRTVVSGKGWRSGPRFLPGDERLLYTGGDILDSDLTGLRPYRNGPAVADIATGTETLLPMGRPDFFMVFGAQVGPGPAIYFSAMNPKNETLRKMLIRRGVDLGQFPLLVWRLPVAGPALTPTGPIELVEDIFRVDRRGVSQLTIVDDGRLMVFEIVDFSAEDGKVERFLALENGVIREVARTRTLVRQFSASHDGTTGLVLGDPGRNSRDAAVNDFFLVDMTTGEILPLPLRQRVQALLR